MTLMSDNGDIREDLRVPDNEVGKEIMAKFQANEEFYVSRSSRSRLHFQTRQQRLGSVLLTQLTVSGTESDLDTKLVLGVLTPCPLQVSVMSAMGEECAIGTKTMGNK